ncbi:MAG: SPOR domain-containing protein [Gammaproteobacteria bacterium]|jgi:cell division protein FtsN
MDERDDDLARLYRHASREEPPAQLDLAVMDSARRAARQRTWSPSGKYRLVTGVLAAAVLVGVVLLVLLQVRTERTAGPDAAATAAPEWHREPEREAGRVPLSLPPLAKRQGKAADVAGSERSAAQGATPAPSAVPAGAAQTRSRAAPAAQPTAGPGPPAPRFDFHATLPVMPPDAPPATALAPTTPELPPQDSMTPSSPATATAPGIRVPSPAAQPVTQSPGLAAPAPGPPAAAAPSGTVSAGEPALASMTRVPGYYLQVGAFRGADYAGRFRERLEALQLPASVEVIELANRETWHRVRVGPYRELAVVEEVRTRLQTEGIDTLLVKTAE